MQTLSQLAAYLETLAPLAYQESYDNVGLLVGIPTTNIKKVLISLDVTENVIEEAHQKGCELIISHHPIIFSGIKKLNGKNYVERCVMAAIQKNIALYAIHTNLDNVYEGVNAKIAQKIGLTATKILSPKNQISERVGAGMIGILPEAMEEKKFMEYLAQKMNLRCIRHTQFLGKGIRNVAVCGGAGSFLLPDAVRQGADVFITADYKYHQFFDAENRIIIADIGHYESEIFTTELLEEKLKIAFPMLDFSIAEVRTNPVHYWIS